jgi:putative transposase
MPRANRSFLPGHVWHLTHRCHLQEFLLKFTRDRLRWRHWLLQARMRYGLCVLNYIVTSNHIHLLVRDQGLGEIARSMQLIAGRTAQEYNHRKGRAGAYWRDRYHATAVESGSHLARCITYIDLNMVRAGAVAHPREWQPSGYHEIQHPRRHHGIIDHQALQDLLGFDSLVTLQRQHAEWVTAALQGPPPARDAGWTEGLAVGSAGFVAGVCAKLGAKPGRHRIVRQEDSYRLQEVAGSYKRDFEAEKQDWGPEITLFSGESS